MPPELRNVIYQFVVTRTNKTAWVDRYVRESASAVQPALLRTCAAIRAEALPIFYSTNTFIVETCSSAQEQATYAWLRDMGASGRGLVKEALMFRSYYLFCTQRLEIAALKGTIAADSFVWGLMQVALPCGRKIGHQYAHVLDVRRLRIEDLAPQGSGK